LSAPVHFFTNFVRGACAGTRFHQLCLDQSEIALKGHRAKDWGTQPGGPAMHGSTSRIARIGPELLDPQSVNLFPRNTSRAISGWPSLVPGRVSSKYKMPRRPRLVCTLDCSTRTHNAS